MFPELKTLVEQTKKLLGLFESVLAELKTSNELSRQIVIETKQLRAELGKLQKENAPAEGNFYRGNETTSHGKGPKEPKEPGKCNSDCNGHCKADK